MDVGRAMSREIALENLVITRDVLASKDIPLFLAFGTLLGALREHDFIAHDDDMDVHIFERDKDAFLAIFPDLAARGLAYLKKSDETRRYSFIRNGVKIDIFMARELKAGGLWRAWDLDGRIRIPARHLDKLESIDFLGENFYVPADPYGVVANLYGRTWNIPMENRPPRQGLRKKIRNLINHPEKAFFYLHRFIKTRLQRRTFLKLKQRDQREREKGRTKT